MQCQLCDQNEAKHRRRFQMTRYVMKCLWICDDCLPDLINAIYEYRKNGDRRIES